ncbi:MAG: nicotinate-nucleotide adenylyltransferase [Melioribacteraceae bacterium]|nr:nicotinate-nucleotide adenylyltransferase [Melioribacteraceae bacterium]MCF8352820.1 nicotinate-nucleotide adenylyltransferase [Melioribacteraceae bacterium]MCF8393460.1 nicotinate-nucleotide adenylyltransferase [Melioribacteraceae bacterium]MCF8417337.1 nicotinate-nucleotide adenylyltransferase [Melioribacteraceae bacterium]
MSIVGIFGGSFDPIHNGHLITAQYVLEKRNYDKIIFIPCYISPHKIEMKNSATEHRLQMTKLAISGNPYFDLSTYEIERKKVSHTIDTLKYLRTKYENLELIIGYDNLIDFDSWYKPEEIIKLAQLAVLKRSVENTVNITHGYDKSALILDTPQIDISSTMIRDRVKEKKSIDYLVPEIVKEYILKNKLYID